MQSQAQMNGYQTYSNFMSPNAQNRHMEPENGRKTRAGNQHLEDNIDRFEDLGGP